MVDEAWARGERFQKAREDAGLNVSQAAKAIGCSVELIHQFEAGLSIPTEYGLNVVSNTYGITADRLMYGLRTELDPALTAELAKLSPDDQRRVAELLSILRKG